jgi:hypothetical protein
VLITNLKTSRAKWLLARTVCALVTGVVIAPSAHAADMLPTNVPGISAVAAPPAGFNPLLASDAALAAYALPPRPDAAKHPVQFGKWKRAMLATKARTFGDLVQTNRSHGAAALTAAHQDATLRNTTYNSTNWSGYANLNSLTSYNTSSSFYFIFSDFFIPAVTAPSSSGSYYSSEWVGIDGFNSGDVLQAGVESNASGSSSGYNAWIEWYPYNESAISLPVAPGDDMFIEVWNVSAIVGYAYVENITTGAVQEYELTPPSGTKLVGNSAEWVVEAPGVNGSQSSLSDYHYDVFWGAGAYNHAGTEFLPGSSTSVQIDLVQGGTTYSTPYLFDSSAIEFVY